MKYRVAIQLTNFEPEFRPQFVPEILFWKGHLYELEFVTLFYSTFACRVRAETRAKTGAETLAQNFVNWIATLDSDSAQRCSPLLFVHATAGLPLEMCSTTMARVKSKSIFPTIPLALSLEFLTRFVVSPRITYLNFLTSKLSDYHSHHHHRYGPLWCTLIFSRNTAGVRSILISSLHQYRAEKMSDKRVIHTPPGGSIFEVLSKFWGMCGWILSSIRACEQNSRPKRLTWENVR